MELNAEQRRAVEAVRGPVCILAGAGSGKTTTITHRIANQVASGAFHASQILAVTFTDKAAGEMRGRLESLGVTGVRASTFHSAALRQLHYFRPDAVGRILASKALVLYNLVRALPPPFKFRAAGDFATEIEWARNRRISPPRYLASLDGHAPPVPGDLMLRVYQRYEALKREQGLIDFEDVLERAIELFGDEHVVAEFRERYCAFTVDEYQDVNLLQQTLLDRWLGDRDDLCVVGDDYQSIYGFTGATPEHLLGFRRRFPHAEVIRLEENYRSTPQVLELANRLVPQLGGAAKVLRAVRPDGPVPEVRPVATADAEAAYLVGRIQGAECALEEIAILARTHARLADFEAVLADAGIPHQGAALLAREAARRVLRLLDQAAPAARVRGIALELGWLPDPPADKLGEREETRQRDLTRLVRLAEETGGSGADFRAELERRFGDGGESRRGVHLLTYHGAKGLEFELVLLPRLEEKELPSKLARAPAELEEERRLLYVGMTRAKRGLVLTWVGKPSRFLAELSPEAAVAEPPEGFEALKAWRLERARRDDVPAYLVFHNSTLEEIAGRRPRSLAELAAVPGVGPAKLERYGEDVLAALAEA
ncbi:MAG TPA: ATP-dependent DNA helicase UvrD2 [Gaiellaceae bacterium]|nr:ATP-dependent DNA helicase UvrD2 [Gaiellaceae bacterium]